MGAFIVDKNAKILDIGAGTGICGESLRSFGFTNLDALEPANDMLEAARSKSIYNNYFNEGISENSQTSIRESNRD